MTSVRAALLDSETLVLERHGSSTEVLAAVRTALLEHPWSAAFNEIAITHKSILLSDVRVRQHVADVPLRIVGGARCPRARTRKSDERCIDETCTICNVRFYLDTTLLPERPNGAVYAGDMRTLATSVVIAHPKILLFHRRPGQHLELCAIVRCAPAYAHARHVHAVAPAIRLHYELHIDDAVATPIARELRAGCTERVFDIEDGYLVAARPKNCIGCGRCTHPLADGRIPVALRPSSHECTFESSVTPPAQLLVESTTALLDILQQTFDAVAAWTP